MRTKVLHFIDSLGNGGAEHLLVNVVNNLDVRFENYIVIFNNVKINLNGLIKNAQIINLKLPFSVNNFFEIKDAINQLIIEKDIDVVHSHSYWTNLVSRFLIQKNNSRKIIFFQSYHNAVYKTLWGDYKVKILFYLDKLTLQKNYKYIAVSDYVKAIVNKKLSPRNLIVLKNFIDKPSINYQIIERIPNSKLKLVSVGSFKKEKNLQFVIEALSELKHLDIEYYIYGGGNLKNTMQQKIADLELKNVYLMGINNNILNELTKYDMFIMPSISEACPLSPLEAMSAGLPLLLSNIPPLKEIAQHQAEYFDPYQKSSLVELIQEKYSSETRKFEIDYYSEILNKYSKENYINKLQSLYLNEN